MWKIILFVTTFCTAYAAKSLNKNQEQSPTDFIESPPKCGPGEILDNCPSNCSDFCPMNNEEFKDCSRPYHKDCPPPKCICSFNHRRAHNGTCIPTIQCPAFQCSDPNEEYNPCPSYCPSDACSQATPNGECPYPGLILIVVECAPSCRCKPTYWRMNGICVPYAECGKNLEEIDQLELNY